MLALKPNAAQWQRAARVGKRAYHDLLTGPNANTVVTQGPPGYSAVSGQTVTVFGCTGFLGRYVVSKLGKIGTQVITPYRDEDEVRHLKLMGDFSRIVRMEWDLRDENAIAECLRHSDTVINLVGRDYPTKNFDLKSVNALGAERIAKIAADNGVRRFVQLSHINADINSSSEFYASKAEGEVRVQEVFPDATILRPSILYGYEDKLLTNMAIWPIWWKLNNEQTRVRPVHVMDVAEAIKNIVRDPKADTGLYNLPGPSTLTYEYLLDMVSSVTLQPPSKAPTLPKVVAKNLAKLGKAVWWPVLAEDEVERRYINDSEVEGDWDRVNITPSEIEDHAITYLRRYRSSANFVRPVVFPRRPAEPALDQY